MDDDGLLKRGSGEWVKRKHYFLQRYCHMFTQGMRRKWGHLTYVDLMAGPGMCQITATGEVVAGSPLIALEYEFDQYMFFESDPDSYYALNQRVANHAKAGLCEVSPFPWESVVSAPGFKLPEGLTLAFVDPNGIRQAPWSGVQSLALASQHLDILMTIQSGMGISLNRDQYLASTYLCNSE